MKWIKSTGKIFSKQRRRPSYVDEAIAAALTEHCKEMGYMDGDDTITVNEFSGAGNFCISKNREAENLNR